MQHQTRASLYRIGLILCRVTREMKSSIYFGINRIFPVDCGLNRNSIPLKGKKGFRNSARMTCAVRQVPKPIVFMVGLVLGTTIT